LLQQEEIMTTHLSRRAFIRGAAAATCATAASALPAAAAFKADDGQFLATLIDIRKCIGCESCVDACREVNAPKFPQPELPFPKMVPARSKPENWMDQQDRTDRLTPYNWVFIQQADVTYRGEEYNLTLPRRCMHCVNPPCVKLCPWGAARQLENGIARIDSTICLGGAKCRKVCPWQIPQRQSGVGLYLDLMPAYAGNGVMYKCDRCYDRLAKGGQPACIDACPEGVQTIGPRDEIVRRAHAIAEEIDGFIYGENENGGTNTLYVSPVPFALIDQAIETGHPTLRPVDDRMADGNNLAKAMLLAPLAGVAAALGKFFYNTKSST
jgi:formate dehydrogenase iron-sulfur subunit